MDGRSEGTISFNKPRVLTTENWDTLKTNTVTAIRNEGKFPPKRQMKRPNDPRVSLGEKRGEYRGEESRKGEESDDYRSFVQQWYEPGSLQGNSKESKAEWA